MSMTPAEYQQAFFSIATAGRLIVDVDVPDLLRRIERAHTLGPIVDPTLYRDKVAAMDLDKDMLEAALPLWRWAKNVRARALEQADRALEAAIKQTGAGLVHPLCGGTYERQGVSSGTCGTVWGPPTCSKCGAILAEGGA